MDTVQKEVEHHGPLGVWKVVVDVEEEPMQSVFEDCPYNVTCEKAGHGGA